MEKATLKDLIARKMQKENDKVRFYEIPVKSLGKSLVFKKPSDDLRLDLMDEMGTSPTIRETIEMYKKLIYRTCELLQDTTLHEEIEVSDPYDTVDAIFSLDDITDIGEKLMDAIDPPGEEIKNS